MELKDILLLLDPAAENAGRLKLAAALAQTHGAAVHGLCLYQVPPPSLAACYAVGARAEAAVLQDEADAVGALLAPAHKAFIDALSHGALPPVWEPQPEFWVETALARTTTADLVVVGHSAMASERWRDVVESLALCGGAPVLVVPEDAPPAPAEIRRAVVAWNGSREAQRALDDALVLLKSCERIDVVVVEKRRRSPDSDLPGLVGHLQRHGVAARVWRLETHGEPVAHALRRHCQEARADLLVLGAYSHSKVGEQMFGGVTRSLLRAPAIPTLVSH